MPSKKGKYKAAEAKEKKEDARQLDAEIVTSRVYQKWTVHHTVLSWRVPDYQELNCGIMYFQTYEKLDVKCMFRVLKTEKLLCLTVTSSGIPSNTVAQFLILDEVQHTSLVMEAQRPEDGVYMASFLAEDLSPESGYLRQGVLTAAFKYASDAYHRFREEITENKETLTDLDELCCDLKRMYLEAIYPDFEVNVGEYVFSAHKFILAARSEYFNSILMKDASLTQHTLEGEQFYPGIVHEVFLYMYSGELKELPVDCMLRMYWTAYKFQVENLCIRCLNYFDVSLSPENYMEVCKFAVEHEDMVTLKNRLIRIEQKNLPGVNILEVIKGMAKDKKAKISASKSR